MNKAQAIEAIEFATELLGWECLGVSKNGLKTIFVATLYQHQMDEVATITYFKNTDSLIIVNMGNLLFNGPVSDLYEVDSYSWTK